MRSLLLTSALLAFIAACTDDDKSTPSNVAPDTGSDVLEEGPDAGEDTMPDLEVEDDTAGQPDAPGDTGEDTSPGPDVIEETPDAVEDTAPDVTEPRPRDQCTGRGDEFAQGAGDELVREAFAAAPGCFDADAVTGDELAACVADAIDVEGRVMTSGCSSCWGEYVACVADLECGAACVDGDATDLDCQMCEIRKNAICATRFRSCAGFELPEWPQACGEARFPVPSVGGQTRCESDDSACFYEVARSNFAALGADEACLEVVARYFQCAAPCESVLSDSETWRTCLRRNRCEDYWVAATTHSTSVLR